VESRKVFTRDKNAQDKIDALLTNPAAGILIFAVIMFPVFDISQSTLGPWLADTLVGWIEAFRGWVAGLVAGAHPLLQIGQPCLLRQLRLLWRMLPAQPNVTLNLIVSLGIS